MGQYCNPADKLATIACHPKRCFTTAIEGEKSNLEPLLILEKHCKEQSKKDQAKARSSKLSKERINVAKMGHQANKVSFLH